MRSAGCSVDSFAACADHLRAKGDVVAFEATSGKAMTRFNAGQALTGGVGASGSLVLVGTGKGQVLAFDASGKSLWKAQLSGEVLAPPAVEGTLVVARAGDGAVYGLNAADGKQRWSYVIGAPVMGSPSISDGIVIIGADDGYVYAFAAK